MSLSEARADDDFARAYRQGRASVLLTTLVADLETPVSAYLKLAAGRPGNMFLLESVEGGAQRGRYSMIGLDPDLIWRSNGEGAEINRRAAVDPETFVPCPGKPLEALRALLAESRIDMPAGLPPMSAGVFGYLGYDMVRHMERLAPAKPDPIGVPEAILIRPTVIVVFDSVRDEMVVVTPIRPAEGVSERAAREGGRMLTRRPGVALCSQGGGCLLTMALRMPIPSGPAMRLPTWLRWSSGSVPWFRWARAGRWRGGWTTMSPRRPPSCLAAARAVCW